MGFASHLLYEGLRVNDMRSMRREKIPQVKSGGISELLMRCKCNIQLRQQPTFAGPIHGVQRQTAAGEAGQVSARAQGRQRGTGKDLVL